MSNEHAHEVVGTRKSRVVFVRDALLKLGTVALSILAVAVLPSVPVIIEYLRTDTVSRDSLLLTAFVLAASYIFTAGNDWYRFWYGALALFTFMLDAVPQGGAFARMLGAHSSVLLLAVVLCHLTERIWWHVVLSKPIFERARRNEHG